MNMLDETAVALGHVVKADIILIEGKPINGID